MRDHRHTLAVSVACVLAVCTLDTANADATSPTPLGSGHTATATQTRRSAPAAASTGPTQLGQITVTAQSRSQQVQDVPIAIDVLTAKKINVVAATDLSQMNLLVPGLSVDSTEPTQPTYRIRGIETSDFGIGTDSAVGVYINGVYQTRAGGALLALNDVKRIEVLKGPQGTLFGRNTAAGAISIITNKPSDHFEGRLRLRYGNDGKRYGDALLNLPLNKTMALRVSVLDNQSDGWIRDAATGQHYGKDDEWGARAVWRWNITPDTRVLLSWDHDRLREPSRVDVGLIPLSSTDLYQRPPFPANPANYYNPLHAPFHNDTGDGREKRNYNSGTLSVDHSFSWGGLTSTTNWSGYSISHVEDGDGTNHITSHLDTGVISSAHTLYQEFKLSGNTDLTDWVAGVSYWRENAAQTSLARVNTDTYDTLAINSGIGKQYTPTGAIFGYFDSVLASFGLPYRLLGDPWTETVDNTGHYSAYAAYGDVIWHLDDRLDLTTGLRYTHDRKAFSWFTPPRHAPQLDHTLDQLEASGLFALVPALTGGKLTGDQLRAILTQNQIFPNAVGQHVRRDNSWTDISPRLVLAYHFTPRIMGYASLAKGYKAGGYNGVQPASEFSPEHVTNLETGIKSVFPNQHLLINASVYTYRYNDRQTLVVVPSANGLGVPTYQVSNTNQKATGLDLKVEWQPTGSLHLAFNGSYIDSTYGTASLPAGTDASGQPVFLDVSGQPVDQPLFSYTVNGNYTWKDVAGGNLSFDANYGYRGRKRCNDGSVYQGTCALATNFDLGSARQRTDLRLDWTARSGHWGVGAFVRNAFNQRYVLALGTISQSVLGTPYAYITPPRMYGIELRASF